MYDIDFDKIYSTDEEEIHFVKGYGFALIGNIDHPDETSTYHEYFFIRDYLIDKNLETDHNSDIALNMIQK